MRNEGADLADTARGAAILVAFACVVVAVRTWPLYALCVALALLAVAGCWLVSRRRARRYAVQPWQDQACRVHKSREFAQRERVWAAIAPVAPDAEVAPRSWRTEQMN